MFNGRAYYYSYSYGYFYSNLILWYHYGVSLSIGILFLRLMYVHPLMLLAVIVRELSFKKIGRMKKEYYYICMCMNDWYMAWE